LSADEVLLFSVTSPSFFPSQGAAIAVVEGLLEVLVRQGGEEAVRLIGAAERQLYEAGAYEQPAARGRVAKPIRRRPIRAKMPVA
jgi:hypothetical protein